MPIKLQEVSHFLVGLSLLLSSSCRQTPSTTPEDYVGEYVFHPSNASTKGLASFVILKRDHSAFEVRFLPETGEVSTAKESWYLSRNTGENLVIGGYSHSVQRDGSTIRLIINDVGECYEKVR